MTGHSFEAFRVLQHGACEVSITLVVPHVALIKFGGGL